LLQEKVGMKQYTQMTLKGKEIMEFFMDILKEKGITHVDMWKDPDGVASEHDESESGDTMNEQQRLNADYIKNFLGELTPLQESRLLQMRRKLEEQNHDKVRCLAALISVN